MAQSEEVPETDPPSVDGRRATGPPREAGDVRMALEALVALAARAAQAPVAVLALFDKGPIRYVCHDDRPGAPDLRLAGLGVQPILEGRAIIEVGPEEGAQQEGGCGPDRPAPFHVSIPIFMGCGHVIGSLTVLDWQRRDLRPDQEASLRTVAREIALNLDVFRVPNGHDDGR